MKKNVIGVDDKETTNEGLISQKLQTSIESIVSNQEFERYQVQRENHINNFDKKSLANLNKEQVAAELLDSEATKFQQEQDFQVIDVAQQKLALEQAQSAVLGVAQTFRDPKTGLIDLKAGQEFIKASDLPAEAKLEVLGDLNNWASKEEEALEQAREEDRGKIYDAIEDGTATRDMIEETSLDEDEQEKMTKLAQDPDVGLNYPEWDKVRTIIDGVATGKNTEEEAKKAINAGVGKYFDATEAKSLRNTLLANTKEGSPTRRPAHTRAMIEIEEVMDAYIKVQDLTFEEEKEALRDKHKIKNDLDAWALEEDRTDEEIEKKTNSLLAPSREKIVLNWFEKALLIERRQFGFIASELDQLVKKKMKALKKEDVWDTMTEQERRTVRKAFYEGKTVGEVLTLAEPGFGRRPDRTQKGAGFLGTLQLKGGGVATEYSVGVRLESLGGKETDIPTLVPTLTKTEIDLMKNDIIPNRKDVPPAILQKAIDHANKRVKQGKSVFAQNGKQI
jgi:hypothetical protein